jgi:putative ABC transport system permease protein
MDTIFHDLRVSVRALLNRPGFTAVAVATLALGLGATTALFSVVYGVLLRPLPYADSERIPGETPTGRCRT